MAKGNGTTKSVGSGAASASRTTAPASGGGNSSVAASSIQGFTSSKAKVLESYGFQNAGGKLQDMIDYTYLNPDSATGASISSKDAFKRLNNGNILVVEKDGTALEWTEKRSKTGEVTGWKVKSTAGNDGYNKSAKEMEENIRKYIKK